LSLAHKKRRRIFIKFHKVRRYSLEILKFTADGLGACRSRAKAVFRQNKQNRKDARKLFAFLQPTAAISLKFSLKTRAKCAQERWNLANLKPEL